jgi:hypothetical protein
LVTYVGFIDIQNITLATPLVRICDPFPRHEVSLPPIRICHSKHDCHNIIQISPLNKPNIHVSNLNTYYETSRGLMLYLARDKITLVAIICGHVIVAIVPTKACLQLAFQKLYGTYRESNPCKANNCDSRDSFNNVSIYPLATINSYKFIL